ncbi:MAG TPA: hypothetical protein VFV30_11400 [Novosphingobium sp.]|nr:hypothetical protein [Novosphingobium sp.]
MTRVARIALILTGLGLAAAFSTPGLAAAAAVIPEPTDMTLIAMAFAGLIAGRYIARGRKSD